MLALRKAHPALQQGRVTACRAAGDLLILERAEGSERLRVVANFSEKTVMLDEGEGASNMIAAINGAELGALPPFVALAVSL